LLSKIHKCILLTMILHNIVLIYLLNIQTFNNNIVLFFYTVSNKIIILINSYIVKLKEKNNYENDGKIY